MPEPCPNVLKQRCPAAGSFAAVPARIALIYAVIGIIYIIVSDRLVSLLFSDVRTVTLVGTLKGWAFIAVTALLLWFLIKRHSARLLASEAGRLEREALLSSLIDNVGGYIYVKDTNYRYQFGNAAVCRMAGLTAEQLVGCEDAQFLDAATAAQLRANDRLVIEQGIRVEAEEEHVSLPTGTRRTYLSVKMPLRRADGSIYGLCGISTDITERKAAEAHGIRLQSQLVQAQKMEAIGQLTGGIAHDFNNILASVMGYTAVALQRAQLRGDVELGDYLRQIQRAGERAASLVTRMLQFSRAYPADGEVVPLHVQPALAEIIKMLRPTIPSSIDIHVEPGDAVSIIKIDPVELHQLITNLVINARDAIAGKGRITVRVRHHRLGDDALCTVCKAAIPGEYVDLSVIDSGQGIAAQSLDEIFEPFYTTKEVGKGTGLGLSVVHGIVHRLGGHILVSTRAGQGTTISLLFQSIDAGPVQEARLPEASVLAAPLRSATVMVVNDEPALVRLMKLMLERNGYQVSTYTDSHAALAAFLAAPEAIDLVITDQTMPGMTGIELARQMLAHRVDLPVLLCTGYSDQLGMAVSAGVRQVLSKPVTMSELFQAIEHELDRLE
ncbi:MAG: response regulator [Paludibacter sp.]